MKLCFVAHFAYGALTGDPRGHIGGVERQTALMARWLASRGHQISVCTWAEGEPRDEVVDGIRILKICPRDAGMPGLRFFHPRWTALCAAMARADAGVYYQNCAEATTGQVALWARQHRRKFVFSVASDPECDPALPILASLRERMLYRQGLNLADAIITQTRAQQAMLRTGFGLASSPLPMPSDVAAGAPFDTISGQRQPPFSVLWVGRMMPVKRPEMLLDIAAALPEVRFHVVGGADQDPAYWDAIQARARLIPNVVLHGRQDRSAVLPLYRSCHLLLCTSILEGFPNTFLEAFAHGLPVVTTVDPDGVIGRLGLGTHCHSVADFVSAIGDGMAQPRRLSCQGRSAWRYYYDQHHLDAAMPRFESLLADTGAQP